MDAEDQTMWHDICKESFLPPEYPDRDPSQWHDHCMEEANRRFANWKSQKATTMKNEILYWKNQLSASQENETKLNKTIKNVEIEKEDALKDKSSIQDQLQQTKVQLQFLEEERDSLQHGNDCFRTTIKQIRESFSTLQARLEKTIAEMQSYEEERDEAVGLNQEYEVTIDRIEQQRASLALDVSRLKESTSRVKEVERELALERESRRALTQRHANELAKEQDASCALVLRHHEELSKERALNAHLTQSLTNLELSKTRLIESISSCWLHRILTWVNRLFSQLKKPYSQFTVGLAYAYRRHFMQGSV